ncbi:MAG: TPM domain-containing protein [Pseudomonas sp.]
MRLLKHLFARSARRLFPSARLDAIAAAIATCEQAHRGEIMFAVESGLALTALLRGLAPRARAEQVFAQLRTWDTEANNGVLIYLLLADRAIEIVADRGLRGKVTEAQWREVCRRMEDGLRAGAAEAAVIHGIQAVSELLAEHFPRGQGEQDQDELPNRPQVL